MQLKEKEHPLWDIVTAQLKNGDSSGVIPVAIDRVQSKLIGFQVLTGGMRKYIIKKVKDPLRKALITGKSFSQVMRVITIVAKRIPQIYRSNTMQKTTHNLMAIEKQFFEYEDDWQRDDMLRAALKVYKFEIEHDSFFYGYRAEWWFEQQILMVLTGEWETRSEGYPTICWNEPKPYGGKYTIVSAIQRNRERIIEILGEEWHWLKEGKYESHSATKTG